MVHSARHGKWSALIFNIADPRSSHTASYELLSSYSSVHYDDASHGVHLESTVQRGPSLSSNFTKNPSKYNIKLCQMGRWWSNLVKGVKIWQFEGRFRKKNRLESLLQKEENYLPPLRWHRRWKWTRLNWEPNNSNLATRTDFKRLGARPWNISFGLKTWNGFENYRKTTEKSMESFKRQFGSLWWNSFVLENHLYHWKGARLSGLKTEFVILCNVRIWCNIWSD